MQTIESTIQALNLGQPQIHRNLAMFPLLGQGMLASYLLLDEAIEAGKAKVREVSEGGHVPELWFENDGADSILLLDGEELVGAKQNRVLNITILVAAGQKLVIPVSCVEQGRWHHRTRHFKAARRKMYASGRASKMSQVSASLHRGAGARSDQGAVWQDISAKMSRMQAVSETSAMEELYEQREAGYQDYLANLKPESGQLGAVFAINGEVVGVEVYDSPQTLQKVWRKLLDSYAMDAIDVPKEKFEIPATESVTEFLAALKKASTKSFKSVGEGEDLRLEAKDLTGGALAVDGRLMHLSAFRVEA